MKYHKHGHLFLADTSTYKQYKFYIYFLLYNGIEKQAPIHPTQKSPLMKYLTFPKETKCHS